MSGSAQARDGRDREHHYRVAVEWTGNTGTGTSGHDAYGRDHDVRAAGRPVIAGSADPAFRGDPARWNPEDLLVASLSECHMLWYLALAAHAGVVVTAYHDDATGVMVEHPRGEGEFTSVTLRPRVTVADASMTTPARALHAKAHARCFVARSVNFPVEVADSVAVG